MSRGPLTFRQHDLERAIRAARRLGLDRYRVVIERGKMVVAVGEEQPSPEPAGATGWEDADEAI